MQTLGYAFEAPDLKPDFVFLYAEILQFLAQHLQDPPFGFE
jgi:hypothetical protein